MIFGFLVLLFKIRTVYSVIFWSHALIASIWHRSGIKSIDFLKEIEYYVEHLKWKSILEKVLVSIVNKRILYNDSGASIQLFRHS